MKANILTLAITLTVGIILAGSLLMPVISDATTTEKTFNNTGLYYMENPDESISVKYLGDSQWEINGETLVYTNIGATNIIVTDNTFVRNNGQVRGGVYSTWAAADLTISNGTVTGTATVSGSSTSISWTYDYIYVATNEKAANLMKSNTTAVYIKGDSEIIGMGVSGVKDASGTNTAAEFKVVVEDLEATVTSTNTNITVSNVKVNATAVDGYKDLYLFASVTFDAKWGDYTSSLTYNIVIVPSSVTAELSNHLAPGEIAILNALPILIIVALVMMAAGALYLKRDD